MDVAKSKGTNRFMNLNLSLRRDDTGHSGTSAIGEPETIKMQTSLPSTLIEIEKP